MAQHPLPIDWRPLTYRSVGATRPAEARWAEHPPGLRRFERTVPLAAGPQIWTAASSAVLDWGVKTRSGFSVVRADGGGTWVAEGERYWLSARVGPLTVREPVQVVAVVDTPERCGFAYGTLAGHPVSGEEAFVVHRTPDDGVALTLRSLTAPGTGRWRPVFPALLLAQQVYRRRYQRALS